MYISWSSPFQKSSLASRRGEEMGCEIVFTRQQCGLPRWLSGKESACNAGDTGSIPGSRRSPGEGNGNPLRYSCLEKPTDRVVWRATVHGVAKSQPGLSSQTTITTHHLQRQRGRGAAGEQALHGWLHSAYTVIPSFLTSYPSLNQASKHWNLSISSGLHFITKVPVSCKNTC